MNLVKLCGWLTPTALAMMGCLNLMVLSDSRQDSEEVEDRADARNIMNYPALNAMAWETGDVLVIRTTWYDGISVNADLIERGHPELVKDEGHFVTENVRQRIVFDFNAGKVLAVETVTLEILDLSKVGESSDGRQIFSWFDASLVDMSERRVFSRRLPGSVNFGVSKQTPRYPDPRSLGVVGLHFEPFERALDSLKLESSCRQIDLLPSSSNDIHIRVFGREVPEQKLRVVKDIWFDAGTNLPERFASRVEYQNGKTITTFQGGMSWKPIGDIHVPERFEQGYRQQCIWNDLGIYFTGDVSQECHLDWLHLNRPVDERMLKSEFLNNADELRQLLENVKQIMPDGREEPAPADPRAPTPES